MGAISHYGNFVTLAITMSSFVLSGSLLYVIFSRPSLRSSFNVFVIGQLIFDNINSLYYVFICTVATFDYSLIKNETVCQTYGIIVSFFTTLSIYCIFHIPLDPYLVVVAERPTLTRTQIIWCFVEMLAVALLNSFLVYVGDHYVIRPNQVYCYLDSENASDWTKITIAVLVITYSMPICLLVYVYYKLYQKLRQHRQNDHLNKIQRQLCVRGFLVFIAFMVGFSYPVMVEILKAFFNVQLGEWSDVLFAWCTASNLLLNPIIYYYTDSRIRHDKEPPRQPPLVEQSQLDGFQFYGAIVSLVLSLTSFILLVIVLYAFLTAKSLRSHTNAFSLGQLVIDFLTSIFMSLFCILHIPLNPYRVLVMKSPPMSLRSTFWCFVEMTSISCLLTFLIYASGSDQYGISPNHSYCYFSLDHPSSWTVICLLIAMFCYGTPSFIMCYIYYRIHYTLQKYRDRGNTTQQTNLTPDQDRVHRLQEQMAKRGALVLFVFLIGYTFPIIYFISRSIFGVQYHVIVDLITAWCMIFNLILNPLIYYFTDPRVRQALGATFGSKSQEEMTEVRDTRAYGLAETVLIN
ncbi:hypothetical protein EDD86DRAFT_277593 [Gorgonomyces haynaldii]|nr:hypothetical protein EDD86DRAFT_277593 [Gorgonomyces haynaldii]